MLKVYRRDQRDHGQPFFTLRATVNSCLTPTAFAALRRQSADVLHWNAWRQLKKNLFIDDSNCSFVE